MKMFKQIRYYGDNNVNNYPAELTGKQLFDPEDNIFKNCIIYKIEINAAQGVRFYINESTTPNIIGINGNYQLDLLNVGLGIDSLCFNESDIKKLITNKKSLIIDMTYDTTA